MRKEMILLCSTVVLLSACSGGGGSSSGNTTTPPDAPKSQVVLDAEADAQAAEAALLEVRASSNAELLEGVSLFNDTATSWLRAYLIDEPLLDNRFQRATLFIFQSALAAQDDTIWGRYGAWDLMHYLRKEQPAPELDDSGSTEVAAVKSQTLALLEDLHEDIEARLVQSIYLHDPLAPSAEAMFPQLLENGLSWLPRGTVFFSYPFNAAALDTGSAEAGIVADAYARGESTPSVDALENAYFWRRYVDHGAMEQGARTLASLLGERTFRMGTVPLVFGAIVAERSGQAPDLLACVAVNLLEQVESFAEEVFAAAPGDELAGLPLDPIMIGEMLRLDQSITVGGAQAASLTLFTPGVSHPERPAIEHKFGSLRVYREDENILMYYAREGGSSRESIVRHIEVQSEEAICLPRSEYVELVAEFSD